jgi:hypothetical protein
MNHPDPELLEAVKKTAAIAVLGLLAAAFWAGLVLSLFLLR